MRCRESGIGAAQRRVGLGLPDALRFLLAQTDDFFLQPADATREVVEIGALLEAGDARIERLQRVLKLAHRLTGQGPGAVAAQVLDRLRNPLEALPVRLGRRLQFAVR
jgi:hypothetical protein